MRNETNKRNLFIAIGFGFLFILIPNTGISSESLIINQNFILSLVIYTILSYLALYCYSSNKIAGIVLLMSIMKHLKLLGIIKTIILIRLLLEMKIMEKVLLESMLLWSHDF